MLEPGQARARLLGVGQHLVGRAAVLAHEALEPVVAHLEGVAAGRVDVEVVEVGAQPRGHVVELGGQTVEPPRQAAELLVERGGFAHQALRDAHRVQRRALVLAGQQGERARGALEKLAGVTQPLALVGQTHVLARLHGRAVDLVDLEAQHVDLALALARVAAQLRQLAREGARPLVGGAERAQGRRDAFAGGAVQQVELALELKQARVLELPVEGEAAAQRLFDRRRRAQETVHVGARAPAPGQLAGHGEGAVVALEERLHRARSGPGAHQLFPALLAHEQPDRLGQQRLAGAGLAGDDVQARRELEARLGDEHQVVDRPVQRASRRSNSFSSTFW